MAESDVLAERAARYHDEIMDIACGPGGILIAFPRFDTRKPFREGETYPGLWNVEETIEGAWSAYGPKPTAAEFLYGENTLVGNRLVPMVADSAPPRDSRPGST